MNDRDTRPDEEPREPHPERARRTLEALERLGVRLLKTENALDQIIRHLEQPSKLPPRE